MVKNLKMFVCKHLLVHYGDYNSRPIYTVSQKKPDTCDIFKNLQQIWTSINNFWYRESSINLQSSDTKLPCEIS